MKADACRPHVSDLAGLRHAQGRGPKQDPAQLAPKSVARLNGFVAD
jgi:hypothetical protein